MRNLLDCVLGLNGGLLVYELSVEFRPVLINSLPFEKEDHMHRVEIVDENRLDIISIFLIEIVGRHP